MKNVHIELTFTDPILGMSPSDPDLYMKYIASRAPATQSVEDEVENLTPYEDGEEAQTVTVFPRDRNGDPCFMDYQIRGFFKDSCGLLQKHNGVDETGKRSKKMAATLSGKLTAYKKVIDGGIFVTPRKIPIQYEGDMSLCQRPLRASTAQGERIALACSEQIPAGAKISFDVKLYSDDHVSLLAEWMAYGQDHGMGQWRNSGKGRFVVDKFVVTDDERGVAPYFDIQYA
jgi:hypothetical protein